MPFCTECGNKLLAGLTACPACGTLVTPVGQTPPPGPPSPPPYNPPPHNPQVEPPRFGNSLDHLLEDISSFNIKWVVPIDTAFSPQILENRSVWIMLLFGFFPLAILALGLIQTVGELLFALTAYYCMAWGGYFYYFVCRRSANFWHGVGCMAFTTFIGVPILLMLQGFPIISTLYSFTAEEKDALQHLLGFVGGVGMCEELTKAAPVLIMAYYLGKLEKPLDGIFFGAMSGLGFGIAEGTKYIGHSSTQLAVVVQTLIRTTTLPFMHALWAATSGYFIALAQVNKARGLALVVLGISVPAVHHGLYDLVSASGGGPLSLALAALLYLMFVAYMERSQNMVAELQAAERQAEEHQRLQQLWHQTYGGYAAPLHTIVPTPGGPPAHHVPQQYNPPPPTA